MINLACALFLEVKSRSRPVAIEADADGENTAGIGFGFADWVDQLIPKTSRTICRFQKLIKAIGMAGQVS
jgi:hypothetical protein